MISPIRVRADDPVTSAYGAFGKFLAENKLDIEHICQVMFTGVGSSFLQGDIYGIPSRKVDEFQAIGQGGRFISGCDRAVVVSMGHRHRFCRGAGQRQPPFGRHRRGRRHPAGAVR